MQATTKARDRARLALTAAVGAMVAMAGCTSVRVLPPRAAPPQELPAVTLPSSPIAAGHGRVVIDTLDGPMDVFAQTETTFATQAPRRSGLLCRTPCVVDLPIGHYRLFFSGLQSDHARGDTAQLEVRQGLNVLRRAPGKYEVPQSPSGGWIAAGFGGVVLIPVGAGVAVGADSPAAGIAIGGLGLGIALAAIVMVVPQPAEQQDGASTAWHVPAEAQTNDSQTTETESVQ